MTTREISANNRNRFLPTWRLVGAGALLASTLFGCSSSEGGASEQAPEGAATSTSIDMPDLTSPATDSTSPSPTVNEVKIGRGAEIFAIYPDGCTTPDMFDGYITVDPNTGQWQHYIGGELAYTSPLSDLEEATASTPEAATEFFCRPGDV